MDTQSGNSVANRRLPGLAIILIAVLLLFIVTIAQVGNYVGSGQLDGGSVLTDSETNEVSEHLVLVTIESAEMRDELAFDLIALEDQLFDVVDGGGLGEVDGTGTDLETGASEIYVYGPDADAIVAAIRPVLEKWSERGAAINVTIRRGPIGAPAETMSFG
jgi:hypothetical protein